MNCDSMGVRVGLWYNYGLKYLVRFVWYAICGILFWRTYVHFRDGPEYVYLHQILGSWLCIARGSAAVIDMNCAIILLPMCQSLLRMIYFAARQMNISARWYTINTQAFHIFIGHVILQMTAVHVISHLFNAKSFSDNFHTKFPGVNPLPKNQTSFYSIVFGTVTGITGVSIIVILLLLFLTSLQFVRRRSFNLFWYSHRLFILFYVLLIVHGHKGPLRKQLNIEFHRPGCTQETENLTSSWNSSNGTISVDSKFSNVVPNTSCSAHPEFGHMECQTWIWLSVPLALYICDMICRVFRRIKPLEIAAVKSVGSDVTEVSIIAKNMTLTAGQHVFINCSMISTLEWHPFSIVQVPSRNNGHILKLWIKSSGDWTARFASSVLCKVQSPFIEEHSLSSYPEVKVDGPYCSTMQQITQYKVAVCIAGGVGATPFLSHLIELVDHHNVKKKIQYLHLICTARDKTLLTNISSIVQECIEKLKNTVTIKFDVYFTGIDGIQTIQSAKLTENFHSGRPAFDNLFNEIRNSHKKKSIGVFACGPASICKAVKQQCHNRTGFKTKLLFYKESF